MCNVGRTARSARDVHVPLGRRPAWRPAADLAVRPTRIFCFFFLLFSSASAQRFVILGDRTGEAQPGVYEAVWREVAAEKPEFVISVGDSIQGGNDATAEAQWREWQKLVEPYRRIPLYLTPGNHDIWYTGGGEKSPGPTDVSAKLYRQYSGRPLHYSFDRGQVHFTILDNSLSDAMPPAEMKFLEEDLDAHATAGLKIIISHRPSWIIDAALGNKTAPLHELAKRSRVKYIIAGHVHQLIHAPFDGVEYVSVASSGGHLRLSKKYEDGWFFGYSVMEVRGANVTFQIHELKPPDGEGRVTNLEDWGKTGLLERRAVSR